MTMFLDVRLAPVGGPVSTTVAVNAGTDIASYAGLDEGALLENIRARHVLIAAHGFNVNRADGIRALSNWEKQLQLPGPSAFVGLLWPGDSTWAHGLDYPDEPKVANAAGQLVAAYLDVMFTGAASVSLASHSLGGRVILATIAQTALPIRRAIIMAGAIDNDCFVTEFASAAAKVGEITVVASRKDEVLSALFPLGNFFGGILAAGHPWMRAALGHTGPASPAPANMRAPYEVPDGWNFGHGDYLRVETPVAPAIAPSDADFPAPNVCPYDNAASGWQSAWSAALASARFR